MRGTRFRRPASKKQSSKAVREQHETPVFYQERAPVDPSEVSSRILNALNHLGDQRFALPPFSEHFQRWMKDVEVILTEFETELPEAADQPYRVAVEGVLANTQEALRKRIDDEKVSYEEVSKLQQERTSCELELSNLEREYRTRTHEAKKGHERSLEKLMSEIDSLDKQRLRLLRKGPSIVERILHKPRAKLEESTSALQSKRADLGSKETTIKHDLENLRVDYEIKRKQLSEHEESLKTKLAELMGNRLNDAVELREMASEEIRRALTEAVDRLSKRQTPSNPENIQ
jgi:chromosome segregation ATPase